MKDFDKYQFKTYMNIAIGEAYSTAWEKGWWDTERSFGEVITEIHGELSEVWEAYKDGNPVSTKIPMYSKQEEELADAVIRCMDAAARYNLNLSGAIIDKMEYNKTREYRHGKSF